MKLKSKILFVSLMMFLSFIFIKSNASAVTYVEEGVIAKGIFIDGVDIGGMSEEEAKEAVEAYISNLQSKKVILKVEDNSIEFSFADINYTYENNDYLQQAMAVGKSGNLIKRYKDLKDVEVENIVYDLSYTYDSNKLLEVLEVKTAEYNIKPVNASVLRENGQFKYTDHKMGRKVMLEDTVNGLKMHLAEWNKEDIAIDVLVVDDAPKYTREFAEKCNSALGTFKTQYASSSSNRAGNLANGARLVNNTVLYPGDVFSAYKYLTPFTETNGYYAAGSYANGKVVDSIGGGACQVTTTLYNAVLYSELEVVERAPHSMTIGYAPLSRDSAIAGTYKDLKFKNNTDAPILIEAKTVGKEITFTIWGQEVRSNNRKIEFESVVTKTVQPPADVITKDKTKPVTYRVVTQSAHVGYTTELYKLIYENGTLISRELVNKSTYNAAPNYITEGTLSVEEVPKDKPNKDDKKDKPSEKPGEKPVTKPPKQEPVEYEEPVEGFDDFDNDGSWEDE